LPHFHQEYVQEVQKDNASRLFAYTYHQYAIGHDNSTYMPPSRLLEERKSFGKWQALEEAAGPDNSIELWAGEAGGAGGGGIDGVTNSFASGQWYVY
jgi:hypothetical protein